MVPRVEFDSLIQGLERWPNVAIMSDEIYGQMLYDNQEHISLLKYAEISDRLILLDGWSKTYAMTGWRLGYSVWPKTVVSHLRKVVRKYSFMRKRVRTIRWYRRIKGRPPPVKKMVSAFDERRAVIVDQLNQLPGFNCIQPGGAFYAFPNIKETGMTSDELQKKLL